VFGGQEESSVSGEAGELSGTWEITHRLTAGADDSESDDDPKYLWFLSNIIITGDEWAAWDMPFVARSGRGHGELDVTRADSREPWVQLGIFDIAGDVLRLCMAASAGDPRPDAFSSTKSNGCVVYVARRSQKALPERPHP
jgi:hypothetical protein